MDVYSDQLVMDNQSLSVHCSQTTIMPIKNEGSLFFVKYLIKIIQM